MESNLQTVKDEHCSNGIEMISGPWILKHFVCIQKKWFGKISCVYFGCKERVLFESKFYCAITFPCLCNAIPNDWFWWVSYQPSAKYNTCNVHIHLQILTSNILIHQRGIYAGRTSVWYTQQIHNIHTSHIFDTLL